jgi:hypothetical protein
MPPRLVFVLVVFLLLVVVTAHVLASERAASEPCERAGHSCFTGGNPSQPDGILQYVVPMRG